MKKVSAVYQCNRCSEVIINTLSVPVDEGQIKVARDGFPENMIHKCNEDEQGIAPLCQFLEEEHVESI